MLNLNATELYSYSSGLILKRAKVLGDKNLHSFAHLHNYRRN